MAELALSQWGMDDANLDEVERVELVTAFQRRRLWEAQLLARALGGGSLLPSGGMVVGRSGRVYERVSPSAFLGMVSGN